MYTPRNNPPNNAKGRMVQTRRPGVEGLAGAIEIPHAEPCRESPHRCRQGHVSRQEYEVARIAGAGQDLRPRIPKPDACFVGRATVFGRVSSTPFRPQHHQCRKLNHSPRLHIGSFNKTMRHMPSQCGYFTQLPLRLRLANGSRLRPRRWSGGSP